MTYRADEIDQLDVPDTAFYRLQISSDGGGQTKHMNITPDELVAIRAILEAGDES